MNLPNLNMRTISPAKSSLKQSSMANRNALGYSSVKQVVNPPKLLNYKHIKLVKVQENRFVSELVNVNSIDGLKHREAFNFTEKKSNRALEQRSLSLSNFKKKRELSEMDSPEKFQTKKVSQYAENNRNLAHALTTESSGQVAHPYLESRDMSSSNLHSNIYLQGEPSTKQPGSSLLLLHPTEEQHQYLSDMKAKINREQHRSQQIRLATNGIDDQDSQSPKNFVLDRVLPRIGARNDPASQGRITRTSHFLKVPEDTEIKIAPTTGPAGSFAQEKTNKHAMESLQPAALPIDRPNAQKQKQIGVDFPRRGRNPMELASRTKFNSQDEIQHKFHENSKILPGISGINSRFKPLGAEQDQSRQDRLRNFNTNIAAVDVPSANAGSLQLQASTKKDSIDSFSNDIIKETFVENVKSAEISITDNTDHQTRTSRSKISENKHAKGHPKYSIVSATKAKKNDIRHSIQERENAYELATPARAETEAGPYDTVAQPRRPLIHDTGPRSFHQASFSNQGPSAFDKSAIQKKNAKIFARPRNLVGLMPEAGPPAHFDDVNRRVEESFHQQFKCNDPLRLGRVDASAADAYNKRMRKFQSQSFLPTHSQLNHRSNRLTSKLNDRTAVERDLQEASYDPESNLDDTDLQQHPSFFRSLDHADIQGSGERLQLPNRDAEGDPSTLDSVVSRKAYPEQRLRNHVNQTETSLYSDNVPLATKEPFSYLRTHADNQGHAFRTLTTDSAYATKATPQQQAAPTSHQALNHSSTAQHALDRPASLVNVQTSALLASKIYPQLEMQQWRQTPAIRAHGGQNPPQHSNASLSRIVHHQREDQRSGAKLYFVPRMRSVQKSKFDRVYADLLAQKVGKNLIKESAKDRYQEREFGKIVDYHRFGETKQMTDKEFQKVVSLANQGGDRRVVLHVKNRYSRPSMKHVKLHSIQVGQKPHLKDFKQRLHLRNEQVKEIIEDEYNKFEDMLQIQKEIETREQRQQDKEELKKQKKLLKLQKLRQKAPYRAVSMLSELDKNPSIQRGISLIAQEYLDDQQQRGNSIDVNGRERFAFKLTETSEWSSSEQSSRQSNHETMDQRLAHVRTIDELDFQYREDVQGCGQCTQVNGIRDNLGFHRDKKVYRHVVKFRKLLQKQRITVDDLTDDPHSLKVVRKTDKDKLKMLELINPEKLRRDKILKKLQEEQDQYDRFMDWQEKMWIELKRYLKEKEIAARPKYILKYGEAKKMHMNPFLLKFKMRAKDEAEVKESVWKDPKALIDLRKHLRYILRIENMKKDDFIDNLMVVKDAVDRQNVYFDQVKDLLFVNDDKSTFDKIHDEEIVMELESEDRYEKTVVDEMIHHHNREQFLQKEVSQMHMRRNLEQTSDPRIEYAKKCHHYCSLSMPHMINPAELLYGQFVIIGQSIDEGQARSLGEAMPAVKENFNQLYLSNNNMDGDSFAKILQGLSDHQKHELESIIYSGQNELNATACDALRCHYLDKKGSSALMELKLVDVKVRDQSLITSMLQNILVETRLQKLTISKVGGLETRSVEILEQLFAEKKPNLHTIDISWNKISTKNMMKLMQAIRSNYHIKSLNIAFNPFDKEDPLLELGNFIRQNNNLQHLDLSGVLQTVEQVRRVVKKAKKSLSLLSVHLSHNHCMAQSFELQKYIRKKLKLKCFIDPVARPPAKSRPPAAAHADFLDSRQGQDPQPSHRLKYELLNQQKIQQREALYFEKQQEGPPYRDNKKSNFIIQRTVAHGEIAGNNTWLAHEQCYCCERWKFTLFFVDKEEHVEDDLYIEGSFEFLNTHQKSIKVMDVREYARLLTETTGDEQLDLERFFEHMPQAKRDQIQQDAYRLDSVTKRFKEKDLKLYQIGNLWYHVLAKRLMQKQYQCLSNQPTFDLVKRYRTMVKNYEDADPQLLVYADYMRPNKRIEKYHIKVGSTGRTVHEEQFVPMLRKEELPRFKLGQFSREKKEIPFVKEASVFRLWQQDNKRILDTTMAKDLERWKCHKFIKDEDDLADVVMTIKSNFAELKHVHCNLISGEGYPHIGWMDFAKFAVQTQILDETIEQQTVDRMFIASKVNSPPGTSSTQLFRYEFLELFVRIADVKYRQSGRAKTYNDALKMLLNIMLATFEKAPWQEFRDEHLWKNPPNFVLSANLELIKRVHDSLFPKFVEGMAGFRSTVELVCRQSDLKLTDKAAKFCFGMSKMTVRDEVVSRADYNKLKLVEFLEFIGRVAHAKYQDEPDVPLSEKIERVLDSIFAVYNFKRIEVDGPLDNDETSDESCFVDDDEVQQRAQEFGNDTFLYQ